MDLAEVREYPDDLLEELEDYPDFARLIQAGIDACKSEEDYDVFVRWLGLVRNMVAIRSLG